MVGCDWGLNVNFKSRFHNTYWDAPFKISGSFEEKRLSAFEVKLIYSQSGKDHNSFSFACRKHDLGTKAWAC